MRRRRLLLLVAAFGTIGCAQMKYDSARRYARAHPAMEECWLNSGPKGAALVDCLEKPLVTDAKECIKQVGQLAPEEKRDLEECVLQARESDQHRPTPVSGWFIKMGGSQPAPQPAPSFTCSQIGDTTFCN